jgi:hypothetical protein
MKARSSGKEDVIKVQAEIRDEIDKDRLKRYQREQKKSEEMEESLRKLSTISHTPIDYSPGLIRKTFQPPVIPDYSYLLTEARLKVVNKYYVPIAVQLGLGLICVILSLAFRDTLLPILGAAGLIACAMSLHTDLRTRQRKIALALSAARTQIDTLVKEARDSIEQATRTFEEAENVRIEKIEKLLNGNPSAVLERIEEVLLMIKLPFFLRCTVDFYEEPMITLHLPEHLIIPTSKVSVNPDGTLSYQEKSPFEINKQYSEVMAGTAINIASRLYAAIPTLNMLYIQGLFDKWQDQEYLFSLRLSRQALVGALDCRSGLECFSRLKAEYAIKTSADFTPVQPTFPEWWEKVPREKIRTIKVGCQQT